MQEHQQEHQKNQTSNSDQPTQSPQLVSPLVPNNPGEGTGIAGFVVSVLGMGLVGLILALISKSQSNKANMSMTGLAKAGLVISIIEVTFVGIAIVAFVLIAALAGFSNASGS